MEYRRLGKAGVKVSALSFGSWVTFGNQLDEGPVQECMAAAYEAGVNFFDNAEVYASGQSETLMGKALKNLGWRRGSYLVSTKLFWGLNRNVNEQNTLNRKYLLEGIAGSLKRLDMEYVDLVFCHRADPETPIEETVWAMHTIVERGQALYWGTSEWSAADIMAAWHIADKHHLHKPVMEQPQYNMLERRKVEQEYARLYDEIGLGTTIWSPLASGLLTGKYNNGIPEGSRGALKGYGWLKPHITDPEKIKTVKKLMKIAGEAGLGMAEMALAWCLKNPHVSTVITGASRVEQVRSNMKAIDAVAILTPEIMDKIETVLGKKQEE